MPVTATSLVKLIDAVGVNLNTKTLDEMEPFVEQVRRYGYKAAIGPLCYIPTLARRLADTDTLVSAPIGVPGGIEYQFEPDVSAFRPGGFGAQGFADGTRSRAVYPHPGGD